MLLRAILGLEPDPARRCLVVAPTLPDWLPELTLRNLTVFDGTVDLHFHDAGLRSGVEVVRHTGSITVELRRGDALGDLTLFSGPPG